MDSYVPSYRQEMPSSHRFNGARTDQGYALRGNDRQFRPPPPRSEFTFRAESNLKVDMSHDQRQNVFRDRNGFQERNGAQRGRQNLTQQPPRKRQQQQRARPWERRRPPPPSTRPLLSAQRETTPEQLEGMCEGEARFRAVEDLSDSVEEDMDVESVGSEEERPTKKIRHDSKEQRNDKNWSNPDPYYVLPPVDEAQGKGKEVMRVLRKAKIASANSKKSVADNHDFISFDDEDMKEEIVISSGDDSASDYERRRNYSSTYGVMVAHGLVDQVPPLPPPDQTPPPPPSDPPASLGVWPPLPPGVPPPLTTTDLGPPPPPTRLIRDVLAIDVWPPPPPGPQSAVSREPPSAFVSSKNLKRKRGVEEDASTLRCHKLAAEWQVKPGVDATPWYTTNISKTENVGVRLHKEICHFYEYVRPLEFEDRLRYDLVKRVQRFLDKEYRNYEAQVDYFGSFAAGVYLPNADMDLVIRSRDWMETERPQMAQVKKFFWSFCGALDRHRLAAHKSTLPIIGAKVPIIKYIDELTGLKVDISFENDSGVVANNTYKAWTAKYPALPTIVSLVKHFLLMRGLNDVSTGGLGGFSVTCLVVSLMQHMPQLQSGNMDPMQNLGEVFMEFLDFYGNKFNTSKLGIDMNSPGYFKKLDRMDLRYNHKRPWALCILDPNRASHDISGGSFEVQTIFKCFSQAYDILQKRMSDIRGGTDTAGNHGSLLGTLFAGNYEVFELQRAKLRQLHEGSSTGSRSK